MQGLGGGREGDGADLIGLGKATNHPAADWSLFVGGFQLQKRRQKKSSGECVNQAAATKMNRRLIPFHSTPHRFGWSIFLKTIHFAPDDYRRDQSNLRPTFATFLSPPLSLAFSLPTHLKPLAASPFFSSLPFPIQTFTSLMVVSTNRRCCLLWVPLPSLVFKSNEFVRNGSQVCRWWRQVLQPRAVRPQWQLRQDDLRTAANHPLLSSFSDRPIKSN